MRSKRLTRSDKTQDFGDKEKRSGTKRLTRVGETRSFLSASTPAKQSTRNCVDTGWSDDTDDEISLALRDTPTGLRMKGFLRDEFLSSQTTDSQLDVRWDHTSPDAYKRLQRVPKKSLKQAREDLSDIVCRLAPAVSGDGEEVESVSNTPPLLCSWLQANKATSNNAPFEGQVFKHGQRTKRGLKKKKKPNVQKFDDVLNNLHMCLERLDHDEENEKTDIQRSSRSSVEDDPLFTEDKDQNKNILPSDQHNRNTAFTGEVSLLPKDAAQALLDEEEDLWSDDELFEDNSFILQATQLPMDRVSWFSPSLCGGKRKQISPVLDQPKNKTKRCAVSPKWEKESVSNDLIPPTCGAKSNFTNNCRNSSTGKQTSLSNNRVNMNMKTTVNNNVNYCRQSSTGFNSDNLKYENRSSNRNPFRKHSSFSGYEVNKPQAVTHPSTVTSNSKSPWRKTSSFSGRGTVNNNNQRQPAQSSVTNPVSTHKQVQNRLFKDHKTSNSSASVSAPYQRSAGKTVQQKEAKLSAKQVSPINNRKRNCLDTSWSDEILRQLAEPDELFESQINVAPVVAKAVTELRGEFDDFFDSDDDFSINETMMLDPSQMSNAKKCSDTNALPKPCNAAQQVHEKKKNMQHESNQEELTKLSLRSCAPITTGVSKTSTFKNNGSLSGNVSFKACTQKSGSQRFTFRSSTRQQMQAKPSCVSGGSSSTAVSSKTPSKPQTAVVVNGTITGSKISSKGQSKSDEDISDTQALLSSQTLLDDDSFMKDDALFESQIMAMLDEVEYEATQQSKPGTVADADKISCSPDEIEKKRLAALAKRKKAKR